MIDRCWAEGGRIHLSAISAWEIALLADGGRIELDLPARGWVERFLDRQGFVAEPLDWRPASAAYELVALEHRDPADRLLIATAIDLACPFVTYDARIARFAETHGRLVGFSAIGETVA